MGLHDALYSAPSGAIPAGAVLADDSSRLTSLVIATNEHGYAECVSSAPLGMADSFLRYDLPGIPHRRVSAGARTVYEGRLVDRQITSEGMSMTALGYSQALSDPSYTALWSTTDYKQFSPVTQAQISGRTPDKYNIDTNGRLYISTKKGQTYATSADVGSVIIKVPYGSRKIVGFSFDYTINVPANWVLNYATFNEGYTAAASTTITPSGGAAFNGTVHYVVTACDYLEFQLFNATGANSSPAGEDGANFLQILNLRVVTTTTNRVNTTLGTTFVAGGSRTVTPGSMANIAVGQQLQIKQGSTTAATVVVTAITSTTFTAIFPGPFNAADSVNAHVCYADEIVKDLISTASTLNPTQLSSVTTLVQSPGLDLTNELYQDQTPSTILNRLITLGDNQTTPRQWEWCVWDNQLLQFQPRGATAHTWYVDVGDLHIDRTIDQLANAVYATYQDASGRTLRSATNTDTASVSKAGLTRQQSIAISTTNSTQATTQRDAFLSDHKDPIPKMAISLSAVYDSAGGRYPLTMVRSGDTITIRNLPPTLSTAIDRIRTFRIVRTSYDAMNDTITIEPESAIPSLDSLLAQSLPAGVGFKGRPFIQPN